MADLVVNTSILHSPSAKEYFSRADSRIMIGLRVALEMLGIPVPEYAVRKPVGRPPAKAIADAFNADQPRVRPALNGTSVAFDPLGERRLSAAIAKAQARVQARIQANT